MKSKKNQITELNYTIEALEDEIEYLREDSVIVGLNFGKLSKRTTF